MAVIAWYQRCHLLLARIPETQSLVREKYKELGKVSKKKKKKYGIFHTLVGGMGLKKSFSIENKNKKHGLKMPKIA